MKLKEYVENLNTILTKHPEYAHLDVVYAEDDEGNGFSTVHHTPVVGRFDYGDFSPNDEEDPRPPESLNAICIN